MKLILKKYKWEFLLYILIDTLSGIGTLSFLYFFGQLIELAIQKNSQLFVTYTGISIGVTILAIASSYFSAIIQNNMIKKINFELRNRYYNKILLDKFNTKIDTGEFINATSNKILQLEESYYSALFVIIGGTIFLIFSIGLIIYFSWLLFLITVLFSLIVFALPFLTKKRIEKKVEQVNLDNEKFLQISKDGVKSYWNYWSLNKTQALKESLLTSANNYETSNMKKKNFQQLQTTLSTMAIYVMQILLVVALSYFIFEDLLSIGIVLTLTQVTANYIQQFNVILNFYIKYISMQKVNKEYGYIEKENQDLMSIQKLNTIELKNFSFSYQEKNVLKNINLKIQQGEKVWIKGASGIGKTTLLKQIFYPINFEKDSQIMINNKLSTSYDIRNLAYYIEQDIFLNKDTIWNNLTIVNPKISTEQILTYTKLLHLDHLISSLELGWQTIVSDNMKNLSGGERQRLSILRGLIAQKSWMFLDEINSALDQKTATEIMNYLLDQKDLTVVMISHTLDKQSISKLDQVISLS